ncbi:MAG: hypothetical protein HS115_12445 [Spirochaetales bacterium]|nr:hypothetical protein [Spirochaetales bacterium]
METLYRNAHARLMQEMRRQLKRKNRKGIEHTGRRLHRLRKRYKKRLAA